MDVLYKKRGVSASKEDVHSSIKNLDKGLFPKAFCKIYPDYLTGDEDYCLLGHADGAGTKSLIAYLYWKETGDIGVWEGITQDAIVMNTDDLICVGALDKFCYTSLIGRNKNLIPSDVVSTLINSTENFLSKLRTFGVNINLMGGETADLGDVVRTILVDGTITTRMEIKNVIDSQNIKEGDLIIGLSSTGRTIYETEINSGIGSNGITSARHDTLSKFYEEMYIESFDPSIPYSYRFNGKYKLTDIDKVSGIEIGKMLLSPTRTYLPIIKSILNIVPKKSIHGIIHCTGGGQTKILNFIDNFHIIKDNLFETPRIFEIIQEGSGCDWKEMYQVFNMGHRMELYVDPSCAVDIIQICKNFNLEAKIIGRVEKSQQKKLTISSKYGDFTYL